MTCPFSIFIPRLKYAKLRVGDIVDIQGTKSKITSIQSVELADSNNLIVIGRCKEVVVDAE